MGFLIKKILPLLVAAVSSVSLSAQNISVSFHELTAGQALELLRSQAGYSFIFKAEEVNLDGIVEASFDNADIKDILATIFSGQDLSFEIDRKKVSIIPTSRTSDASPILIKGRVTDKKGESVIGAGVFVVGTTTGSVTDLDGNFEIRAVPGQTLRFSCLGYDPYEVLIGKSAKVDAVLYESVNDLDEAVVIGYGVMKKSDLTGAVATVKTENLSTTSNTSIMHMLSGRAAGVTVTQNSAQPGGGVSMIVRGAASTGAGNEPLYIIDGFPVSGSSVEPAANNRYSDFGSRNPLNSINPNDIESIEILKDASSTAIYGARAANGVIIITTKNGREGKAVVNYNASYGVQRIANKTEMMNATDFMKTANEFAEEKWYYDNQIAPYGNNTPADALTTLHLPYTEEQIAQAGRGTDWYSLVTQDGTINQHNVSVSGGTSKMKYMASFNYYDQNGVVKNSDFTRYTGRINLEHQLSSIFTYGVNATYSSIYSSNIPLGTEDFENSGLLNSALAYDPTVPVYDEDGNYSISPLMTTVPNPVSMLEIDDHTLTTRMLVNAFVQANIAKGLTIRASAGFDNQNGTRNSYIPKATLYGLQEGGKASKNNVSELDKLFEATVNYNLELGNSKFTALAGTSYQEFNYESFNAANSQFFTDQFKYNSLATGENQRPTVGSGKSMNKLVSYFGRLNANLLDKYLFTFTGRVDGSSKFGINNRYAFFPSGAFAWKIKNEDFMQDVEKVSDLKLRVSLGQTGNSNIGDNAFEYYTSAWRQYVFGNAVLTGSAKSQIANPDLKWETTTEFNIGFDLGFFDQRIALTGEYFNKEVKDLLGYRTLKSFMEVGTVAANIGSTQSQGVELTVRSRNIMTEFRWETEFTFTSYRDSWKTRNPEDEISPWQKADDPIRAHYGYLSDGLLQIGETPPESMPALLPGQYKVKDVNGYLRDDFDNLVTDSDGNVQYTGKPDGKIDEADIVLLGTYDPGFSMGIGNTFSYKGFDLNIFFYGMFDRIVNNATRGKYSVSEIRRILNGQNMMYEVNDRWTRNNASSSLPSGFVSVYPQPSDYLWEDAWFIRCKNITLGYTIPHKLADKVFTNARVFFDCANPFVITPYTGNDPETDFKAGYPNQRSFMLGIDLTF